MRHLPKRHLFVLIGGAMGLWYLMDMPMAAPWMRWVMATAWVGVIAWIFVRCPAEWDEMRGD